MSYLLYYHFWIRQVLTLINPLLPLYSLIIFRCNNLKLPSSLAFSESKGEHLIADHFLLSTVAKWVTQCSHVSRYIHLVQLITYSLLSTKNKVITGKPSPILCRIHGECPCEMCLLKVHSSLEFSLSNTLKQLLRKGGLNLYPEYCLPILWAFSTIQIKF